MLIIVAAVVALMLLGGFIYWKRTQQQMRDQVTAVPILCAPGGVSWLWGVRSSLVARRTERTTSVRTAFSAGRHFVPARVYSRASSLFRQRRSSSVVVLRERRRENTNTNTQHPTPPCFQVRGILAEYMPMEDDGMAMGRSTPQFNIQSDGGALV